MEKLNNDGALTKLSFVEVSEKLGKVVGKSEWYSIDQAMIDEFAPHVTNAHDHVWVQVAEVS